MAMTFAVSSPTTRLIQLTSDVTRVALPFGAAHSYCMTDKTSPAGWVVQLTIPGEPIILVEGSRWRTPMSTAPTFHFFNVAIGSPEKALEAARKTAGASDEAPVRVVRALSSSEIASINLPAGEAKPA